MRSIQNSCILQFLRVLRGGILGKEKLYYIGLMQKFVPFLALNGIASQNRSVIYFIRVKF